MDALRGVGDGEFGPVVGTGESDGDFLRGEAAASVEGVEMNEEAISRYQPSMFESTTENGTSSTPEESSDTESSSSESSSASGEESSASESSTEE